MMSVRTMLLILGAVVCSAAGQLLLKAGARQLAGLGRLDFLLGAWAASTVCWLYVLRVAPLSRAYGASGLTYVLIPLASVLLFGEEMRRVHVVGTLLVVAGVACLLSGD